MRFILNGRVEEVEHFSPTDTVLDFLRDKRRLSGTKEGCAEGDCGACTVVVAETVGGQLHYSAVNSCILFLATLDGKQLITIEELQKPDGGLHPVQQAMVEQHGSQCGFCTPGFIMSLFAAYHTDDNNRPSRSNINQILAGNLCRCTGYAPIVRAAKASLTGTETDQFDEKEADVVQMLQGISSDTMLGASNEGGKFLAPTNSAELCQCLEDNPDAILVAGATDVGLWVTKHLQKLDGLIYTGKVAELLDITTNTEQNHISIGSAVTYTRAMPTILDVYPGFEELLTRLGAVQVRNAGTIGGNIANGSPIGDMPPALIALGVKLVLGSSSGERVLELEDFFIDYGKQDLRPGEFVARILLPLPDSSQIFRTYKISKRIEQDISAVCGAFSVIKRKENVVSVRICFGGMAATPKRASKCEQVLLGQEWNEKTIRSAMQIMKEDYSPISDMRASEGYRLSVARNLLWRFYLETSKPPYATRISTFDQPVSKGSL